MAMGDTVGLDGHFPAPQLFQVIPITDRLLRFDIGIEAVCRSDVVDGYKKHRWKTERAQQGKHDVPHGAVSIIERQQYRLFWQAIGKFQAPQEYLSIDHPPGASL